MARCRIDQLLVVRGLFPSRARAGAAIEAGLVSVAGEVVRKASQVVDAKAEIVAAPAHPYVSRGALKLEAALDHASIAVRGLTCLDLGASTGGFTDLLLKRGASRVHAVDVGHDQLHPSLRGDARVVNLEGVDARALSAQHVPDPVDLLAADLSFIGLAKALPSALPLLKPGGHVIVLVKPQFEAGPCAGKRGIIRDEALRQEVLVRVADEIGNIGVAITHRLDSPIQGGDGNREFLLVGRKRA